MVVGLVGKDKSLEGQGWVLFLLKKEQRIPINRQKWQQMRSSSADECRCGGRDYATLSLYIIGVFRIFS